MKLEMILEQQNIKSGTSSQGMYERRGLFINCRKFVNFHRKCLQSKLYKSTGYTYAYVKQLYTQGKKKNHFSAHL